MAPVVDVVAHRPPRPEDRAILRSLATVATRADGHPPFGDSVWRALDRPTPGSAVLLAIRAGEPVGALHLAPPDNDSAVAVTAALVVHPEHRDEQVAEHLVAAACDEVADQGGGRIVLWIFGTDEAPSAPATAAGFALERELHQMRVALPLAEQPRWPDGVDVRAFRPGRDDDTWLAVNNRAFAADPDQSAWTTETLAARLTESWFDPAGFLLAWDEQGLAGFCWTKVHPAEPPDEPDPLGEIYVIGVDPSRQGSGLGRALVVGGLAWLAEHGTPVGMLYVDSSNRAAVALYEALGFTITRRDRAYVRDVS